MAHSPFGRVALLALVLFLFFFLSNSVFPASTPTIIAGAPGSLRGDTNCQTVWCRSKPDEFQFAIVADLDRQSKIEGEKKPAWRSLFKQGTLTRSLKGEWENWEVTWTQEDELTSSLGEAGRGLELSELVQWDNRLWTFDDRTGVVFEVDTKLQCIPRFILMEGDGNNAKGQKSEWATVKDGRLYVGSFGKPYTNRAGEITTRNNMWVSVISPSGAVEHENWTDRYELMQQVTDSVFPGYMIHEAIHWDAINRLWYVLPRRVSSEPYDEKKDETMGSNLMLVFDEHLKQLVKKIEVGTLVPTHGWSSLKFLPGSNNQIIIALRTMELEDKDTGAGVQSTFITVFEADSGNVLVPEQEIPGAHKYEGLEFL